MNISLWNTGTEPSRGWSLSLYAFSVTPLMYMSVIMCWYFLATGINILSSVGVGI